MVVIYDINHLPLIYLGRQGENMARTVRIDVKSMLEAYPGASIGLVFQRAGDDELYIGATSIDDNVLSWPVSAAVTANAGRGKIEVRAMLGDVLAKSVTTLTQVDASLSGAGSVPPDPEKDWIDDVLQAATNAKQSATDAAASAGQAEQAVEDAKAAAKEVDAAKTEAVLAVQQTGAAESQRIVETANDKIEQIDTANAHAPKIEGNGNWAIFDAESGSYQDTGIAAQGEPGEPGAQGPQGEPGPQGPAGQDAPQIDDTQITSTNPWSSSKIVETLCPEFEVSGPVVTCNPVEGYPLSVQASWEPRQEGDGYPSPENVRPITGLDAVTVTLSGSAGTGTTATLTLPETISGGTVDAVTGEGSKEWLTVILTGNETWSAWMGKLHSFYTDIAGHKNLANDAINVLCSTFLFDLGDSRYTPYHFFSQNPGAFPDNARFCFTFDETVTNIDLAKQWIAAQYTAGTPVTIAYKLATPTSFQATGAQSLPTLPGTNTIYSDAGTVTVSGRADPTATINALTQRIAALENATTEVDQNV